MDLSEFKSITIPQGDVKQIDVGGVTIWKKGGNVYEWHYTDGMPSYPFGTFVNGNARMSLTENGLELYSGSAWSANAGISLSPDVYSQNAIIEFEYEGILAETHFVLPNNSNAIHIYCGAGNIVFANRIGSQGNYVTNHTSLIAQNTTFLSIKYDGNIEIVNSLGQMQNSGLGFRDNFATNAVVSVDYPNAGKRATIKSIKYTAL